MWNISILSVLCLLITPTETSAHGFLASPRSRNLVAYEDRVYYPQTENDPLPEDCPNCLNRGGVMARCGMVEQRNYDLPLNGKWWQFSRAAFFAFPTHTHIHRAVTLETL